MWISCPHIGMGKLPCTHPVGSKFTSSIDIFYEPFAKSTFGVGVQCLWLLRTRCFHYRWLLSLAKDCRAHVAWLTRGLQCNDALTLVLHWLWLWGRQTCVSRHGLDCCTWRWGCVLVWKRVWGRIMVGMLEAFGALMNLLHVPAFPAFEMPHFH